MYSGVFRSLWSCSIARNAVCRIKCTYSELALLQARTTTPALKNCDRKSEHTSTAEKQANWKTLKQIKQTHRGDVGKTETGSVDPSSRGHILQKRYGGDIAREDVRLPKQFRGKLAFVLHDVCTKQECDALIEKTESMGYEEALVNIGGGQQSMLKDVRNSGRVIWDTREESETLFERIRDHIPPRWANRNVISLNERLRFLRYIPGEYFKPHFDGRFDRENGERSFITVQLYLNEGFTGGSTTFMNTLQTNRVEVVPKTGSMLIFQHDIVHEGSVLVEGFKYTLRTDVMYGALA